LLSKALHITLVVYSGLPDPQWQLTPDDPNYQQIHELFIAAKKKNLTYRPEQMPSQLGYRGFLVRESDQRSASLILGPNTKELQKLLFQTVPEGSAPKHLINKILEAVDKGEV
jgi:hypothetical protein